MKRIILLNNSQFPAAFNSVVVNAPAGIKKLNYVENQIIEAINKYNVKLNVDHIEYLAIETQFSSFKKGKQNGILIEEFDINPANKLTYIQNGCYVYFVGSRCVCRRIMMYLFVSGAVENTRTAFISQTVFPTLLEYAEEYLQSPSYSIANHKFCFINILNKTITSKMILRHLASLIVAGMEYVEVFNNDSILLSNIPKEMKQFLLEYASDYSNCYNSVTNIYDGDYYRVEFDNKLFVWKTDSMIAKLVLKNNNNVDFNGSAEKFYWIEVLPMALFAYNLGYEIDYSEYRNFVITYENRFSPTSEKFSRCKILLRYIKKYFI